MGPTIVIPVFNQARYTGLCLDSLRASGVSDSQIVVVDNASTDHTAGLLSERPGLNVIRNDRNRGCGYAWNQGVRARPAPWTLLLNNDVLAPAGWLEGLLGFVEEHPFDIVSPALCNGEKDYDLEAFAREFMRKMARVKRAGTASGVCFMVRQRVFDAGGPFDDDPRLGGYEDDEFFRRSRQAGFRLATTGRSFLHHFGSVTQKAIKAGREKPRSSLGDRAYYRQKYGLTWLKRHRWRLKSQILNAWWSRSERIRFGCTLVSDRQGGAFLWR
jgi:GT2 family glycosyltransferase